jgi:hypothetical protein
MKGILPVLILATLMLLPGIAFARRRATSRERSAVVAAAVAAHDISHAQGFCAQVFISTVNPSWASLSFPSHPSTACLPYAANGISLFHRHHARWHFVTAGSSFRCPIPGVPLHVGRDLKACR